MSVPVEAGYFGSHLAPDGMLVCRVATTFGSTVEGTEIATKTYVVEAGRAERAPLPQSDGQVESSDPLFAEGLAVMPYFNAVRTLGRGGCMHDGQYTDLLHSRVTTSVDNVRIRGANIVLGGGDVDTDFDQLAHEVLFGRNATAGLLVGERATEWYLRALARHNAPIDNPARLIADLVCNGDRRHKELAKYHG